MEKLRPSIIKALAQDSPEILKELELLAVFEKQMTRTQAQNVHLRSSL